MQPHPRESIGADGRRFRSGKSPAHPGYPAGPLAASAVDPKDETGAAPPRWLVCSRCWTRIARCEDRIRIADQHEHRFVNPHGFGFHIGCFSAAPGCRALGSFSGFWTWFPGFHWQLAHCSDGECSQHVGWLFRSQHGAQHGADAFYGLILDRLREATFR